MEFAPDKTTAMSILDQIVAVKREEVTRLRPKVEALKAAAAARKDFRDFAAAVRPVGAVFNRDRKTARSRIQSAPTRKR